MGSGFTTKARSGKYKPGCAGRVGRFHHEGTEGTERKKQTRLCGRVEGIYHRGAETRRRLCESVERISSDHTPYPETCQSVE